MGHPVAAVIILGLVIPSEASLSEGETHAESSDLVFLRREHLSARLHRKVSRLCSAGPRRFARDDRLRKNASGA